MDSLLLPEDAVSPEVWRAFWEELRVPRSAAHRRHGTRTCDTELLVAGVQLGKRSSPGEDGRYRLSGTCPCRDLVADAFEVALRFLAEHGHHFRNPAGGLRKNLRFKLIDMDRAARHAQGAPVRPQVVRSNRYGRALPDEYHREVFAMLADEAGVRAPLHGQCGLIDRLSSRCATRFGGHPAEHAGRMASVLRTVERVCRTGPRVNVGTAAEPEMVTWWEAYIERPLGRRPDPSDHPDPSEHQVSAPWAEVPSTATDDDSVLSLLRDSHRGLSGREQDGTLCHALCELVRRGWLPQQRARVLLADPAQRREISKKIDALAPSRKQ